MEVLGYEVESWGVGEIWLDEDRVVNHELPRAGELERQREHEVIERVQEIRSGARQGTVLDIIYLASLKKLPPAAVANLRWLAEITGKRLAAT